MPIYDYRCNACEITVEVTKPITESSTPEPCPTCKTIMDRVFSGQGCAFKLNGRGWTGNNLTKKRS